MTEITRVGADLAKAVIQVHCVDAAGKVVTNRPLPGDKFMAWCAQLPAGCLIAMEASSSAHHWARKLVALGLDARIIAAHLAAPYRLQGKGGKNDANDAAAICAASRPQMPFVPIKTIEQQSMLCIHRLLREGLKQERTACTNRSCAARRGPRRGHGPTKPPRTRRAPRLRPGPGRAACGTPNAAGKIRSEQYVAIEFIAAGARSTWAGSTFDDERRRFRCLPMMSNAATSITGPTSVASAAGLLERLP